LWFSFLFLLGASPIPYYKEMDILVSFPLDGKGVRQGNVGIFRANAQILPMCPPSLGRDGFRKEAGDQMANGPDSPLLLMFKL